MTVVDPANSSIPASDDQTARLAWLVVLFSFVLFCTLCLGTTLGVYLFFFQSSVPLNTFIQVGRGTAVLTDSDGERGLRSQDRLSLFPTTISFDAQSQAVLSFQDDAQNLIALITVKNDTLVQLRQAQMPRFDWSQGQYRILLNLSRGEVDVFVFEQALHPVQVHFQTDSDIEVQALEAGRYLVSVTESRVRVTTRRGSAVMIGRDPQQSSLLIPAGKDGVALRERPQPVLTDSRLNLLENGVFMFDLPQERDPSLVLPERWGCTNLQDALPRGAYRADVWNGLVVLRLVRSENASTNGQTRCKQIYPEAGFDVSAYNYLELDVTFLINYQSLSRCGTLGSECPLMLRIAYRDVNGISREWFQGFYSLNDPQFDYPLRCESCTQGEHRQINEKVWYHFRSGNLFTALINEARPARITEVELYASGHQYDVFIGEVALMAGFVDARPPGLVPQSEGN